MDEYDVNKVEAPKTEFNLIVDLMQKKLSLQNWLRTANNEIRDQRAKIKGHKHELERMEKVLVERKEEVKREEEVIDEAIETIERIAQKQSKKGE